MTTNLPKILIVTHCYATKLPQYAAFLRYQVASLQRYQTLWDRDCDVSLHVWVDRDDPITVPTINDIMATNSSLKIFPQYTDTKRLGRRSIGRNYSALHHDDKVDYVFFTDVDHVFYRSSLDMLPVRFTEAQRKCHPEPVVMIFPREIMIHRNHDIGDTYAQNPGPYLTINPLDFEPKQYNRAIGGVQIVTGAFAREHGYLNRFPVWQTPVDEPFKDFKDDVAYRKFCGTEGCIIPVTLPGVYRLRHTHTSYQPPKVSNANPSV